MRNVRSLQWSFLIVVLALGLVRGSAEELDTGAPLVHVSFDGLVPTSYPVVHPRFDRLRSTIYPLITPDIPRVHITENLLIATAQPLLLTYGSSAYGVSQPVTPVNATPAVLPHVIIKSDSSPTRSPVSNKPALRHTAPLRN
jgi:hypothetical protein